VVDDELASSVEQIEQAQLPGRALEDILYVDLDSRQLTALSVQRVALAGEFLFFGKQLLAGDKPRISRDDFRIIHFALLF
jgi:hypothetical protein